MLGIEKKVEHTAKRAGLLSGGLLLCAVGAGFLTVAGWFALYPFVGIQNTALIFAGIYIGLGFILIGVGTQRSSTSTQHSQSPASAQTGAAPAVVEAFMYGLQAGARADRARR